MHRLFFSILLVLAILPAKIYGQDFDALASKIFFSVDIKDRDTTILSAFNKRPELTFQDDTGWSIYPPLDHKGNPIPFHTYTFLNHPYFIANLGSGRLMVMINKESGKTVGMSVAFSFTSVPVFDSTYKNFRRLLSKYSSRVVKRKGITPPFEVTKYFSKDGRNYIILTKGETDKKPYMHIAYNCLDFN